MPRATNPAEGILRYFKTAPLGEAKLVLSLVKAELKVREEAEVVKAPAKPTKARRKNNDAPTDAEIAAAGV